MLNTPTSRKRKIILLITIFITAIIMINYITPNSNNTATNTNIVIDKSRYEKIKYYRNYWPLVLLNDTLYSEITDYIFQNNESTVFYNIRTLLNKYNTSSTSEIGIKLDILNNAYAWYKYLKKYKIYGYSMVITMMNIYGIYYSVLPLMDNNRSKLQNLISEINENISTLIKYIGTIRYELQQIYKHIGAFVEKDLLEIPYLYEEIYSELSSIAPLGIPVLDEETPSTYKVYIEYLSDRLVHYGYAYFLMHYVYPVIHNITFGNNGILRKNTTNCNISIEDIIDLGNTIYNESIGLINHILNSTGKPIRTSGEINKIIDIIRNFLKIIIPKPISRGYSIIHRYYTILEIYASLVSINNTVHELTTIANHGEKITDYKVIKTYNETLELIRKSIKLARTKYCNYGALSTQMFGSALIYSIVNKLEEKAYDERNHYDKSTINLYLYTGILLVKNYYTALPHILDKYFVSCSAIQ